jgi:2-polyprenyl-6-methoxyphenol hydroxylase-like FAD-dependent oxidoreductase
VQIFGEGVRAGMYPMSDSEVYWFVAFYDDGKPKQPSAAERKRHAQDLVEGWRHGISECIASTPGESISRNRFFDRWPSPVGGRLSKQNITLAGDALHPMTPNLGQVWPSAF